MTQGKWTRAGVRHKTAKWYWIRERSTTEEVAFPVKIGGLDIDSWEWPDPDYERWSEPIKEPK